MIVDIIKHLIHRKTDGKGLDETLNTKSGLLGISSVSGDMRQVITAMRCGNRRAQLAFDISSTGCHSGIGSRCWQRLMWPSNRLHCGHAAACSHFTFLGLDVDTNKNTAVNADQDVGAIGAKVRVPVVRAQEDWAIARECWRLLSNTNHPS